MRGRFSANLKLKNWPALLAEIFIVVIGIFIALQVDDWNNERIERIEEKRYLIQLHQDFGQTILRAEGAVTRNKQNIELIDKLLTQLQTCTLGADDKEKFAFNLFKAGRLLSEQFVRSTILELRSSGRLSIIRDQPLRILLSASIEGGDVSRSIYAQEEDRLQVHLAYFQRATNIILDGASVDKNGPPDVMSVNYEFETLCSDPDLISSLIAVKNTTINYAQYINARVNFYRNMQEYIEGVLDNIDLNWRDNANSSNVQ